MLKTLHSYLVKDLIKVMLLTLVSLTLLLSVLLIIQPLRKLGLAGGQVLELFLYTIPVVLSLTLPFAALFAGTLVYGRFSQDNELLAARASGISTVALLRPALGLGLVVTVLSLILINVVAPRLTTLSGLVQNNMRQVFFHRISSRGYADFNREKESHVIHADSVDPDANALHGIIYVVQSRVSSSEENPSDANVPSPEAAAAAPNAAPPEPPKQPGLTMIWARSAALHFSRDPNGDDDVIIRAQNYKALAGSSIMGQPVVGGEVLELVMPFPNPVKEKTSWYGWNDLLKFLKNPQQHSFIRRELAKIRQGLSAGMLGADVIAEIQNGNSYTQLAQGDEQFEVEAAWALPGKNGASLTSTKPDGSPGKLVTVIIKRENKTVEMVTARQGQVTLAWSRLTEEPQVSVHLDTDVTVNFLGAPGGRRVTRPTTWSRGELPIPEGILAKAQAVDLKEIYEDPRKLTSDKKVIQSIDTLRDKRIPQLRSDLLAELHVRVAYGASCFLMVAMGSALGLMFRGGQFISAVAISVIPVSAVIFSLLMGKELIRNPSVSEALGLACIWGGILLLAAANLVVYARLARK